MIHRWHLITGEYPPDRGGVADYTAILADRLADEGAEVHVWGPSSSSAEGERTADSGKIRVHRVAGRFGPAGLRRLSLELNGFPGPRTILIQYAAPAFGWKAMNLLFAIWALGRRIRRRDDVRVMFHEVAFPWVAHPLRHNLLALMNRVMAIVLVQASTRIYVSSLAWITFLRRLGAGRTPTTWIPVPSNVAGDVCPDRVAARQTALRAECPTAPIVGHFGTYGTSITRDLGPVLHQILNRRADLRILLLGAGSDLWRCELAAGRPDDVERIIASGALDATAVGESLQACDLLVQPYPDGVSCRRGSMMAAIGHGRPVATTLGPNSEPIWSGGAVATVPAGDPGQLADLVIDLLEHPAALAQLGQAGRQLYEERFAVRHTVAALQDSP